MTITKQNMVNAGSNFAARLREDEEFKEAPDDEVAVAILVSAMALAESKKLSVENLIGRARLEMLRLGEIVTEPFPVKYGMLGMDLPPPHVMQTLLNHGQAAADNPLTGFEYDHQAPNSPVKEESIKKDPGGPEPGPPTEDDKLYERSGKVCYDHRLVDFLYELMKSDLTPGKVEAVLRLVFPRQPITFSNGWLARYAHDVAQRILNQEIPEATPDPKEPARLS